MRNVQFLQFPIFKFRENDARRFFLQIKRFSSTISVHSVRITCPHAKILPKFEIKKSEKNGKKIN